MLVYYANARGSDGHVGPVAIWRSECGGLFCSHHGLAVARQTSADLSGSGIRALVPLVNLSGGKAPSVFERQRLFVVILAVNLAEL